MKKGNGERANDEVNRRERGENAEDSGRER